MIIEDFKPQVFNLKEMVVTYKVYDEEKYKRVRIELPHTKPRYSATGFERVGVYYFIDVHGVSFKNGRNLKHLFSSYVVLTESEEDAPTLARVMLTHILPKDAAFAIENIEYTFHTFKP